MASFGSYQDQTYQNTPNASLMFAMYSTTFGYGAFNILPPAQSANEVGEGFPTIPYLPLEAIIYNQQASNPAVSPYNVTGGANAGQQQMAGLTTSRDSNNTTRYGMGFFNG
jgi:hypothetical protein